MNIIDATTVSAFLTVIAFAVVAVAITFGWIVREWVANRPAAPASIKTATVYWPRFAH